MDKKKLVRLFVFSAFLIFMMVVVPQTIALGKQGFGIAFIQEQFFFYTAPGLGFLLAILLLFGAEYIITKDDKLYGDSLAFVEQGDAPSVSFFKKINMMQMFLLSMIFSLLVGLFSVLTKQSAYTGVASLEQQFTAFDNIIYSSGLVVISENLGAAFIIALTIFTIRHFSRKYNLGKANFYILNVLIIPITIGTYGFINHLLRYSAQDTAKIVVFMFWAIGGLITLVTGSFIPFATLHFVNNLFVDMTQSFSSELTSVMFGGVILILGVIYFMLYPPGKKKKVINNIYK